MDGELTSFGRWVRMGRKAAKAERDGKRDIREGTENDSAFGRK
jgi:hypothetical protein